MARAKSSKTICHFEEVWKDVPSHDELQASNYGRIRVKPYLNKNGHLVGVRGSRGQWSGGRLIYKLSRPNKPLNYKVARLVCEAFNGPPPFEGAYCLHIDEDSRNNTPSNLKWGTQKENLNFPLFKERQRAAQRGNKNRLGGKKFVAKQAA